MKKLLVFLFLLALTLPGCDLLSTEPGTGSLTAQEYYAKAFLFQKSKTTAQVAVKLPCSAGEMYSHPGDLVVLCFEQAPEEMPTSEKVKGLELHPWLLPADMNDCCILKEEGARISYILPDVLDEKAREFRVCGQWQGLELTVYKVAKDSEHYAFDRQIFSLAEKGLPLPENLSRLEEETKGRREILWEDKVFVYENGILKGIVFQREDGLVAIEYSDAPAILQVAQEAVEKIQNKTAYREQYVSEPALYLLSTQWHKPDPNWGRPVWQEETGGEPVTLEQHLLSCLDGLSLGPVLYN